MNGIHDMGGMHGFGKVVVEAGEPVFHARWEGRVFAMTLLTGTNIDAARHAMESVPPHLYLARGYYWRWLTALEKGLVASGAVRDGEIAAEQRRLERGEPRGEALAPPAPRPASDRTARRAVATQPRFALGSAVRASNVHPAGHTRLPRYVRGHVGTVFAHHGGWVFPDTHAHGEGENPQHVYCVRFDARELWGPAAEPSSLYIDLFESYLEPA